MTCRGRILRINMSYLNDKLIKAKGSSCQMGDAKNNREVVVTLRYTMYLSLLSFFIQSEWS
jgi:hypothetical protein